MAKKLNGMLNLSKIPKEIITQNKAGDKVIYVDIVPNKNGADQYGNTHSIQLYNKETKQVIYLGNLKEVEFGTKAPAERASVDEASSDLPFSHRPR